MTDHLPVGDLDAHRDVALEQILADQCLSFVLGPVPLGQVDWDATTAGQIRGEGTDPDIVERYAAALHAGEQLPAGFGVADDRGHVRVVGGIHRAAAHREVGADTIPLYLLPDHSPDASLLVAALEHNSRHGVPLSNADRARHALVLIDEHGLSQVEAGRIVGLSGPKVSQAATARDGGRRAKRANRSAVWRSLSSSTQYRLAAGCRPHTDAVFAEMLDTAAQCGTDVATATAIAAGLTAAGTEGEALDFLAEFEAGHHPAATPSSSGAAAMRDAARKICEMDPERFAGSVTPSFVGTTIELLERTARRLAECAIALKQRGDDR